MILSQPVAYQPAFSKKNSTLKKGYITHGSSSYLIQSSQNQFDSHHINRHRKSTEKVSDITKAVIIQQTVMNTPYQDDIKSRRRFFTQEEDLLLTNAAIQYNEKNWANIAKNVPGRTPRQCRDRWMNYLKPNLKFDPWSKEEDALLTSMVNSYGTHWAKIVAHFPGRSTNAIKNRWNWLVKDRIGPVLHPGKKSRDVKNSIKNDEESSKNSPKDEKEVVVAEKKKTQENDSREIIEQNIFAIWQEPLSITFDPEELNW